MSDQSTDSTPDTPTNALFDNGPKSVCPFSMKVCTACKTPKTFDSFRKLRNDCGSFSRDSRCRKCRHLEKRARRKKRIQTDPVAKEQHQRIKSLQNHGLNRTKYKEMLLAQNGKCAVCGSCDPRSKRSTYFAVDHDHATGVVRSLLCFTCNAGLGLFQDNPDLLIKAAAYLWLHRKAAGKVDQVSSAQANG